MLELLADSVADCARLLPFLFLSYLAVELMEHKMSSRTRMAIYRAGKAGPVLGGLLGILPQCGFAAAAAGLYAGGIITPGTLLAVFLSTSDEMLPILVSVGAPAGMIGRILVGKAAVAITAGLLFDAAARNLGWHRQEVGELSELCEKEHCHCKEEGVLAGALRHTAQVAVFLFAITLALGLFMDFIDVGRASQLLENIPLLEEVLAGLIGMVPNCAASVLVTQLYLQGLIGAGALFAGLLCGAGAGLLVLYRMNRRPRENLWFTAVLYGSGVVFGLLAGRLIPLG